MAIAASDVVLESASVLEDWIWIRGIQDLDSALYDLELIK